MTFRSVVIGLGSVGMGYDLGTDAAAYIRTHARAFQSHPDFELVGGIDADLVRRKLFQSEFDRPAFERAAAAASLLPVDVVAVATPTSSHAVALTEALAVFQPKAVLCEKPITHTLDDAQAIINSCETRGASLFVNYMRRSEPGAIEVKRRLRNRQIETPVKGVAWYSKGLLHTGSHLVELLTDWLGPVTATKVVDKGRVLPEGDGEPDVNVTFEGGTVMFLAAREECFSHYEIELLAPNGRLRYESGGAVIHWQPVIDDPDYPGYRVLRNRPEIIASDMNRYQYHVVDNLARALRGQPAQLCSGWDAIDVLGQLRSVLGVQ